MNKRAARIILSLLFWLGFLAGAGAAGAQRADASLMHLGWVWAPEGASVIGHVVDSKGLIYAMDTAGTLYNLSSPGRVNWTYHGEYKRASMPVISVDGEVVYFVGDNGKLHAIRKDGQLLWAVDLNGTVASMPIAATDGTLIVLTRIRQEGNPLSEIAGYRISPEGEAEPIPLPQGISQEMLALNSKGDLFLSTIYRVAVIPAGTGSSTVCEHDPRRLASPFVIGPNDTMIYARQNITLKKVEVVSLRADCTTAWTSAIEVPNGDHTYALAHDNGQTIYVGGLGGHLYALNATDGNVTWTTKVDLGIGNLISLRVGRDGTIFGVSDRGRLLGFDRQGRQAWSLAMYEPDVPRQLNILPSGDLSVIHAGELKVYTTDPSLVRKEPAPLAAPINKEQAEKEIVAFMVDFILREEIKATEAYIENSGQPFVKSAPEANIIVYGSLKIDPQFQIPSVEAATPQQVWTYSNGTLGSAQDGAKAIEEYENRYIRGSTAHIWAYGYYEFGFYEISTDYQSATVYLGARCGSLCGHGVRLDLDRSNDGKWWIYGYEELWIS